MRYKWSKKQNKWVTFDVWMDEYPSHNVGRIHIQNDIEPFISPITGKLITSRSKLREHNRVHGVTNAADYKNEWADAAKKRAAIEATEHRKSLASVLERRTK